MAEIVLLRHSMTKGNLEGRYIGCRTDEPLCEAGIRLLENRSYPSVDRIYASPMKRCVETAQIIWGSCGSVDSEKTGCSGRTEVQNHRTGQCSQEQQVPMVLVPELRECDFGDFENKNYEELNGDPAYQAWIDSGGTLPFPGGESMDTFKRRCQRGFAELVIRLAGLERQCSVNDHLGRMDIRSFRAALVVHGGTVMAIMERFGHPKKDYFDYQVKNGCGYLLTPVEGTDLWNYQCLP